MSRVRRTTMRTSPSLPLARRWAVAAALGAAALAGCDRNDMHDGAQIKPYESSPFFTDGMSSRPLVEGTVPRAMGETTALALPNEAEYAAAETYPFPITREDLYRGQQRYTIYCAPCHGAIGGELNPADPLFGYGNGMIVRRGFTPPPSFHIDRLRQASPRHFYDVMTNGYGAMYSYSDRVNVDDRWRIAAYIQTLQLSQNADPTLLTEQERQDMISPPPPPPPQAQHARAGEGHGQPAQPQHPAGDAHGAGGTSGATETTETTTHE